MWGLGGSLMAFVGALSVWAGSAEEAMRVIVLKVHHLQQSLSESNFKQVGSEVRGHRFCF